MFNENSLTDWIGEERLLALRRIRPNVPPVSLFLVNQQISSAVFEDCSLVEIALRNKLSSGLQARLRQRGIHQSWLEDPTYEFRGTGSGELSRYLHEARSRAQASKIEASNSDVLAELTLGFWVRLFSKKFQPIGIDLLRCFDGYHTRSIKPLLSALNAFRVLRNRVAHHHGLLHRDLDADTKTIAGLAYWLDPELAKTVSENSRLEKIRQKTGF